jgi:Fe-S cluster assembly scaffold protein SufB
MLNRFGGRLNIPARRLLETEDCALAIVERRSTFRIRARSKHASPHQLIVRRHTRVRYTRVRIRGGGVFNPAFAKAQNKFLRGEWRRSLEL